MRRLIILCHCTACLPNTHIYICVDAVKLSGSNNLTSRYALEDFKSWTSIFVLVIVVLVGHKWFVSKSKTNEEFKNYGEAIRRLENDVETLKANITQLENIIVKCDKEISTLKTNAM